MTQEYKELLIKDLCARLPYDVKVFYDNFDYRYLIDKGLAVDATGLNIYKLWNGY